MKNYDLILDVLAEKIKEKDGTIALMQWQLDDLKKQLEVAEQQLK